MIEKEPGGRQMYPVVHSDSSESCEEYDYQKEPAQQAFDQQVGPTNLLLCDQICVHCSVNNSDRCSSNIPTFKKKILLSIIQ